MARDLQADLKLCEAATPGPWTPSNSGRIYSPKGYYVATVHELLTPDGLADDTRTTNANVQFIAAAREGWPEAIARAMEAEAKVRDLEARLEAAVARTLVAEARVRELEEARSATTRTYLSKHGELFVCDGISGGRWWSTYYRTPSGSLKRLRTMPLRPTMEQAQRDLDDYARLHGLPVYPRGEDRAVGGE